MEKLEKLELVKFDEINKNNVKVFHFKMQVDIQLSCASVLAYFNERLALAILFKNDPGFQVERSQYSQTKQFAPAGKTSEETDNIPGRNIFWRQTSL